MSLASIIEDMNKLHNAGRLTFQTRNQAVKEAIESYRVCNQKEGYEGSGCPLLERVISGETTFCTEMHNAMLHRQEAKFVIDNISILGHDLKNAGAQFQLIDAVIQQLYGK